MASRRCQFLDQPSRMIVLLAGEIGMPAWLLFQLLSRKNLAIGSGIPGAISSGFADCAGRCCVGRFFRFRKCKNRLDLTVGGVFWPSRLIVGFVRHAICLVQFFEVIRIFRITEFVFHTLRRNFHLKEWWFNSFVQ